MHRLIENAKTENRSLLETEAKELLLEYDLPVPAFKLIFQYRGDYAIVENILFRFL